MIGMLAVLVVAALLEVGGDAAIRHGLLRSAWPWMLVGSMSLASYGFLLNTSRSLAFNHLMGVYIALFFVVSQGIAAVVFGDRPSTTLLVGGALIVAGGLVIQSGAP